MRRLLLALTACLAVLAARAYAEEEAFPIPAEDVAAGETVVEVDDLDGIDLGRMLGDLFEDDNDADDTDDIDRESRADGGDDENDGDMTRFNNFIDTLLRRLNAHSRTKFDPLSIGLAKKSSSRKGKGKKEDGDKEKVEEDGETKGKKKKEGKKGKRKGGKKGGKKGKKGKGRREGRHPKDLELEEVDVESQDAAEDVAVEEEVPSPVEEVRKKREADLIEEEEEEEEEDVYEEEDEEMSSLARERRDADEVVGDESTAVESSRRGKPAPTKGGDGKVRSKDKKKKKKKKKKAEKKGEKKGGKKGGKKNRKNLSRVRTSRASLTGIATLRRSGDVKVVNKNNGKEIRSQVTLGPVDLKISRKFGFGKDAISRTAKAESPELKGKMYIYVSADGKAKVTKFHIARPAIVKVDGSLLKTTKSGASQSNNFMEKSISRVTPLATKKLRQASREVLSASEPRT